MIPSRIANRFWCVRSPSLVVQLLVVIAEDVSACAVDLISEMTNHFCHRELAEKWS